MSLPFWNWRHITIEKDDMLMFCNLIPGFLIQLAGILGAWWTYRIEDRPELINYVEGLS